MITEFRYYDGGIGCILGEGCNMAKKDRGDNKEIADDVFKSKNREEGVVSQLRQSWELANQMEPKKEGEKKMNKQMHFGNYIMSCPGRATHKISGSGGPSPDTLAMGHRNLHSLNML